LIMAESRRFNPESIGLSPTFRLTAFSRLKG
jgi:hypothetical protein